MNYAQSTSDNGSAESDSGRMSQTVAELSVVPRVDQPARAAAGQDLRAVMAHFPTGVTVIGSHADGKDQGMTANSVTCVSLNPPLIAVCTSHGSRTVEAIDASGGFSVTFLASDQEDLARQFSRNHDDHFKGMTIGRTTLGHPYLPNGIGFLECVVRQQVEAGDHSIVIGEVKESVLSGGDPLVFFRSKLGNLSRAPEAWTNS
jgi:flavin reductase (DIM6/NTAB) family NADH-FMN oxidoreductase RutF